MTPAGFRPPRAGAGSGLLLAATVLVLVAVWPERPETANTSWYPVAALRSTGLAGWAWTLGWWRDRPGAATAPIRLAYGALLTAPLEALAHAASAPAAPLAWSLVAPLLLAWTLYGAARLAATGLRRLGGAPLLAPAASLLAAGLLAAGLRSGIGASLPWTLPRAPSLVAAVALGAGALATWIHVLRRARGGGTS